jgi:hypothetical protein
MFFEKLQPTRNYHVACESEHMELMCQQGTEDNDTAFLSEFDVDRLKGQEHSQRLHSLLLCLCSQSVETNAH